jgi:hypothetical protein
MISSDVAEFASGGMIFILYFMKITQLFQKVLHLHGCSDITIYYLL